MQKLKRVVIKEEFVALTGDFVSAAILNQFLYWTERMYDFDKYIIEEKERALQGGIEINMPLTNGWIYKSTEQLNEELMMGLANSTLRKYIKKLIDLGYLDERNNPNYAWDRTKQYRVNLVKLQKDLLEKGYALEGVRLDIDTPFSINENAFSKNENGFSENENRSSENEKQYQRLNTEIKTEIKNKDNNNSVYIQHQKSDTWGNENQNKKEKIKYAEYVSMTEEEYNKLIERFGLDATKEMIEILDNYKGATGAKYKSDYRAILNWVIDKYNERHKKEKVALKNYFNSYGGQRKYDIKELEKALLSRSE